MQRRFGQPIQGAGQTEAGAKCARGSGGDLYVGVEKETQEGSEAGLD